MGMDPNHAGGRAENTTTEPMRAQSGFEGQDTGAVRTDAEMTAMLAAVLVSAVEDTAAAAVGPPQQSKTDSPSKRKGD